MAAFTKRSSTVIPWVLVALLLVVFLVRDSATADRQAANKAAAAGSKTVVAAPQEDVVLLTKDIKTSNTQDLIFHVSAECSIVTDVETIGNDNESATGHIEVWIEIDGEPVLTAPVDPQAGRVVFCDRTYGRETLNFQSEDGETDEGDETIRTYFNTRSTHGFNWVAFDLGHGTHTIEVHGMLEAKTVGENSLTKAEAVIGNRTLIIEPAKFANDADLIEG